MLFSCLVAGKYSLLYWVTDCSKQQPKQQTGELPVRQRSTTSDYNDAFDPGLLYADIQQNPKQVSPPSPVDNLYANVTSNDSYENPDAVVYSELQRNNAGARTVAPSGELYTQVQKR